MSCGQRSQHATPVSILTGRKKTQFHTSVALCFLDETRRLLLWTLPPTSLLHIPNLSEIASSVPEICDFKNWLSFFVFFFFLFFFLFSHTYKNRYKTRTQYPIALKFGTLKGGIKAHLGAKFGWNEVNVQKGISDYLQKITPICCHAYRVNRLWEEAENQCIDRLTIEPQTFCGLKEIELKPTKIQRKDQQCVAIMQLRLADEKITTCHT